MDWELVGVVAYFGGLTVAVFWAFLPRVHRLVDAAARMLLKRWK